MKCGHTKTQKTQRPRVHLTPRTLHSEKGYGLIFLPNYFFIYFYSAFYIMVYKHGVLPQKSFKNATCFNISKVTPSFFLIKGKGFRFEQSTNQKDDKGPLMRELIFTMCML